MLTSKTIQKYLNLKKRLDEVENEFKDSYTRRRNNQEREAIERIKADQKAFYSYVKKFCKVSVVG